jgi:hypothetical protein
MNTLEYFYTDQKKKQGGSIPLNLLHLSISVNSKKIIIKISNSKRIFTLKAHCEEEAQDWYQILSKQVTIFSKNRKSAFLAKTSFFWKKPRISVYDFARSAKTGDLILFRSSHLPAGLQRTFTRSHFDHVGMIVEIQGSLHLFQAVMGGVCLVPWRELLNDIIFNDLYSLFYRKLNFQVSEDKTSDLLEFIRKVINKKFRFSVKDFFFLSKDRDIKDQTGFFCSELVASAYKILKLLPEFPVSNMYWPGDFSSEKTLTLQKGASFSQEQLIDKRL